MRRPAAAIRAVSRVNRPPPRTNPTATAPATIPYGLRCRRPSMSKISRNVPSPDVPGVFATAIIDSAPASRDARHEIAQRDSAQQAGRGVVLYEAGEPAVDLAEPPFRVLDPRANALADILHAVAEARVHALSPCGRVISFPRP